MSNKKESSNFFKECEICKSNANCLCFECNSYFCEDCHKFIHSKQVNSSHKKEEIDPYIPIEIKCPNHPKDRMNLFCLNEKGKLYKIINNIYIYNRNVLLFLLL